MKYTNKNRDFEKEIIKYVANFINVKKDKLNLNSKIDDFITWDSIAHVNLILSLEKKYKVKIVAEDYFKLKSIKKILTFLEK